MSIEAVRKYVSTECKSSRNALGPALFDRHLRVVVDYSKSLAGVFAADLEIVELAAWLHDIAAVRDVAALPRHPAGSADIAREVLAQKKYPSARADHVARCILSHAVPIQIGSGIPEEVCLSNADAMSRLARPMCWLYIAFRVRHLGFDEGRTWLLQRVESDWAALIRPGRDMIEKEYRQTRELLTA